ncbi:MAG: DUF599 domain-containing protein [Rubrivivax sp.]|jgi:uncharacterized membrane protein|nr:DUF599 domain-containing protein [Rubrivivax sp.]
MDMLLAAPRLLPPLDWAALLLFFAGWIGYALFARRRSATRPSLLALTNRERRRWMLQTTWRDNRVIDGIVVQNLSTSPSFFASTTILIIGGLLAALSTADRASEVVASLPFAARTSAIVFEIKLGLLTGIFVYAFFRFTWSLRQYTFGALLVAAAPAFDRWPGDAEREAFADRAGRVMGLAAETFNDGLRAYYMSFAVCAWFFSPWAFVAATAGVVWVLYRREFHSEVLAVLDG